MTNNDVELTVEKIDKTRKERNISLFGKYLFATQSGAFVLLAFAMASTYFPGMLVCLFTAFASKLVYNSERDNVSKQTSTIDDLKSTITYEDYQKYHKSKIKSMNRSGFAPSSTTKK